MADKPCPASIFGLFTGGSHFDDRGIKAGNDFHEILLLARDGVDLLVGPGGRGDL